MKTFTLRSQFYTPTHFSLITNNPSFPKSQLTKTPPRFKISNTPVLFDSQKVKITPKTIKLYPKDDFFGDNERNPFWLSAKVENLIGSDANSRCLIVGAVTLGFVMLVMGSDDHQKALAFGPEGPLLEDFWDNMRRYGLYALSVSTGVLYAVFQPLYELLKNPISAILVLVILGGLALGGFVLSKAADYIVERQEILFVKAMHMHETNGPNDILQEAETNKAKYKLLTNLTLVLFLMTLGTLFLSLVEKLSYFEAFYCVCATITTLGYGDKSFSTRAGRLFAVFWILITTVSLAQLFVYLVELWTENRRRALVHWVLNRKLTVQDLEKADLDDDKVVSAAEYVLYKLREMGKVSNEDIAVVVEGFKNLDVDHSGTLTANDLKIIESFEPQC